MYAAELRLPPDTNKADREQVVTQVLEELEMTQAPRHPRRQALRRSAQTRVGRAGTADRSVAADPRRTDLRPRPGAGPPGHDDAAPARRRGPRGAGRHPLADLPRRLRPGAAAGARRQDRVLRATQPDRRRNGHHQLGRHLQQRRAAIRTPPTSDTSLDRTTRRHQPPRTDARGSGQPDAHQRATTVLHDRASPDAADRLRPRLLHLPGVPAVHHGCAVAVGARRRRLRRTRPRDQGW